MKKIFLIVIICTVKFHMAFSQIKVFKAYEGISEVITSTELKPKNNSILFFDSEKLSKKNCHSKFIWYKIIFSKKMTFSLCLIPNTEQDTYTMEAYRLRYNIRLCDSIDMSSFVIPNLLIKKAYNDNAQTTSFRNSLLFSNDVDVNEDEIIYILIYNKSGIDLGHVLDVKTPKGEYIFKATKDTAHYALDCNANANNGLSFNVIKSALCDNMKSPNLFGMIKFENNQFCEVNYTKHDMKLMMDSLISVKNKTINDANKQGSAKSENSLVNSSNASVKNKDSLQTKQSLVNVGIGEKATNAASPIKKDEPVSEKEITESARAKLSESQNLEKGENRDKSNPQHTEALNSKSAITNKDVVLKITVPGALNDSNKVVVMPIIKSLKSGDIMENITTIRKNEFEIILKKDEKYELEYNVLGYKKYTHTMYYESNSPVNQQFTITLTPLEEGESFVFKNITFFPNTPVIKKASESELLKLVSFMKECPKISISVEGHTNGSQRISEDKARTRMGGAWAFHGTAKELSIERAKVIQNYLVTHGIDKSRLEVKGFGGNNPIYDIKDPEESYKNMRVEIRILKIADKPSVSVNDTTTY